MKFSIIIPVYNVEKYVERCILSCVNQNLASTEYEIIVINDGSPDNSLEIINGLAKLYDNIKVFTQENQGLSVARNNGLKFAIGEYIWFVDSDDWIEPNCILDLYNKCKKFSLDVLLFDANDYFGEVCTKRMSLTSYDEFPIDGRTYLLSDKIVFPVCFKIMKRDFLIDNHLFFMENIMHEDNEFIPRMFFFATKVLRANTILYNVYNNPKSITRSINPKKSFDLIKVAKSHATFLIDKIRDDHLKIEFYDYLGLAINSALNNTKLMDNTNRAFFYLELKKNKDLFFLMKKSSSLKYRLEAQFYLISPNLFRAIYSIYLKYN
ncbi:glycosyltransferase [Flavobacterium sp. Fl-77]|uniref:Glycosyltransferase n=1 Tax=Flavobacterium flavipigmentatum TaxID=2893884 RepID=A0AAJ2S982_9FLAO|nr:MULTISPECIES: glycosyltransferase [unclassified Flavobacterium]MDX6182205.1 glycosyltransferase [Flavobacterium sp. Fl-33]MDX6185882.1 glycosyltransferase [Flavobacterium sp. Fl-77]UFH39060.1 glycosyltransferase [Flavobacterium sp. F-70]